MPKKGNSPRKERSKRHYEKHRDDILAKRATERSDPKVNRRKRGQRKAMQDYLIEQKHMKPCVDCKVAYPYYVMDFDHVRGEKVVNLARMIADGYSLEAIQDEIAKCDLVCSNCHRERTHGG